ncbi:hypothetical protein ACHAWF_006018, partial [Thalassiosira exigua]
AVRSAASLEDGKPAAADGGGEGGEDEAQALVLASNRHLVRLGHEVSRAHLELRRLYHPKFPELEELLTDPFQYRAAVGILRNESDVTRANDALNDVLSPNQVLIIGVAGGRIDDGRPFPLHRRASGRRRRVLVPRRPPHGAERAHVLRGTARGAVGAQHEHADRTVAHGPVARAGGRTRRALPHPRVQLAAAGEEQANVSEPGRDGDVGPRRARGDLGRVQADAPGRRFREELGAKFAKWEEPDKAQVVKALPNSIQRVTLCAGDWSMQRNEWSSGHRWPETLDIFLFLFGKLLVFTLWGAKQFGADYAHQNIQIQDDSIENRYLNST